MPRQLPWASKGGGGRTQVKQPPKTVVKPRVPSDIDDDFFSDTVLASTSKGKKKAKVRDDDSEDDLQEARAPSSSPPPIQDMVEPQIELMRKGVSKFDLRDDEWMMVEDEFLETAKLFTQHLHIAEYVKLKERIEAKKKEQLEAIRPTVKGAVKSVEGQMKDRATAQEKKQKQAIRELFVAPKDDETSDATTPPVRRVVSFSEAPKNQPSTTPAKPPMRTIIRDSESDSEDLDAPTPAPKRTVTKTTIATFSRPIPAPSVASKPAPAQSPTQVKPEPSSSFIKPAIPTAQPKSRVTTSRRSRATPFDMLDDYTPPTTTRYATSSSVSSRPTASVAALPIPTHKPSPTLSSSTPKPNQAPIVLDDDDGWTSSRRGSTSTSTQVAERLAKRKAEREAEAEKEKKRKVVKLDDIPTFLF